MTGVRLWLPHWPGAHRPPRQIYKFLLYAVQHAGKTLPHFLHRLRSPPRPRRHVAVMARHTVFPVSVTAQHFIVLEINRHFSLEHSCPNNSNQPVSALFSYPAGYLPLTSVLLRSAAAVLISCGRWFCHVGVCVWLAVVLFHATPCRFCKGESRYGNGR